MRTQQKGRLSSVPVHSALPVTCLPCQWWDHSSQEANCASLALASSAPFKVEDKASHSAGGFGGGYAQVGTREQNTDQSPWVTLKGRGAKPTQSRDARLRHPGLLRTEVPP